MAEDDKSGGTKFGDMSGTRKLAWIGKFIVAVLTFGFAFPNIMNE